MERWKQTRDEIHREVCEQGYDPERRTFTQYYGSKELDASVLNIPLVGFLPGTDERVTGTIDAISRELGRDGFVSRYSTAETDDGLSGDEGQFLACSFWLVSALALNGRVDEARELFERLIGLSNDLGLLAEEYDVKRQRQVGNFPQAFSHLTLIGAAVAIAKAGSKPRPSEGTASVSEPLTPERPLASARRLILPLALAQFICSFAGSNMNVMINDISEDLDTTVKGVQTAITLFLLIMAILMIPCSKLTDRWGRKRCFTLGLTLYGIGALLSAVSPSLGVLILGNSVLEGVGTALLIPPVYILTTLWFTDTTSRAWAFGAISGMGGIGAAAGPLIGGLITTAISWRAAFVFQALVVARSSPEPPHGRPAAGRPDAAVRRDRRGPVGGRDVLRRLRDPPGRHQQRALLAASSRSEPPS